MPGTLIDKIALVTGAGSSIGRACAVAMAREGATVAVSDHDGSGAEETLRAIKDAGGDGIVLLADASCPNDVKALIRGTVAAFGRMDCACNCPAMGRVHAECIHAFPVHNWDRAVALNARDMWLCLKHEMAQMQQQGSGSIVNIALGPGLIALADGLAYVTSGNAVVGLSMAVASEYACYGIRVNAICPGIVDTPGLRHQVELLPVSPAGALIRRMIFRARRGTADELAESVAWLCSDGAGGTNGLAVNAVGYGV